MIRIGLLEGSIIPISKLRINGNTSFCKIGNNTIAHIVTKSIVHPEYDEINFSNDVALVKVSPPFKGRYEKPIKLYPPTEIFELYRSLYALGWGITQSNGTRPSEQLRIVKLRFVHRGVCRPIFQSVMSIPVPKEAICAGWLRRDMDTCTGDSGGPLFVNLGNNKKRITCPKLIPYFCGQYPALYMEVSQFYVWIKNETGIKI
ncbi:hypothetical protein ILUMI_09761 [Ignelater luminosus]|uniref:Peptidase S1 domain-containing protein n=1 Tax=Ignelater luminosus TaxID=2038154 RepID=A0A8K0GFN0_IGNLU|nr:hypothetical protein ILUMI_09761 [Ignelater luminosus]